jgi:HlyD family secretion protein
MPNRLPTFRPMPFAMRCAINLAALSVVTFTVAGAAWADSAAAPASVPRGLPAISVVPAGHVVLVDRVYASGLAGPVETVEVQPRISGYAVESVEAEVGDLVQEGQVLARLSSAELVLLRSQIEAQIASAEAAIAQAEAQRVQAASAADEAGRVLTRATALRGGGNVSQAALDQADAAAISARAMLSVAEQGLKAAAAQKNVLQAQLADNALRMQRTDVVAPVAGEITDKSVTIGAIATSGGVPMFKIVKDAALEVMADVAEQDVLKLKPGQSVSLRFVGASGRVAGTVRLVEPQVDKLTRLGRVRIALDATADVRSGMFAEAEIRVAERETLAVPVSATSANDEAVLVLKVVDGVVQVVPITTGIRDGAQIEVLEGLSEGDSVVLKAGSFVRDGDRINPVAGPSAALPLSAPPVIAGAAQAK